MRIINRLKRADTALLFILPGLAGLIVFYLWPFLISVGYSFMDKAVGGTFVGARNYLDLFQNKAYLKGLANTLYFISASVPLNMCLSLGLALLVNRVTRHKEAFVLVFLIPLVIPSGSMVFFWRMLFSYNGYLNYLLTCLGAQRINWLETSYVRFVILTIFIWKNLGYNMVLFMAGLSNIPKEYYEAARVDGAGAIRCFRHITLPNLLPTTVLTLIMSVINSFKVFKEIYLVTGSYPHDSIYMLQHFMNNMFGALNYQKLATATSTLVLIIAVLTQVLFRLERKAAA